MHPSHNMTQTPDDQWKKSYLGIFFWNMFTFSSWQQWSL